VRVFVTGWNGLLGNALLPRLRAAHEVDGFGVEDGEVTDPAYVRKRLDAFHPEAVLHLAAWTAVDACEADPDRAFRVNAEGSRVVATEATRVGARVIGVSTDYVFDGEQTRPYTEDDVPSPKSVYGKSKLAGENEVRTAAHWAIVRTAWLYGEGGRNFVDTILTALDERGNLEVVNDQVGSPTYAGDLSQALITLLEVRAEGLYHVANLGEASWFDLAREAARLTGRHPERIRPATTAEVPRPAPRPAYSVLDCRRVTAAQGLRLRPWRDALADYLAGSRPHSEGDVR
jgi:dTDP-4-dehydrorhamnose reductase